MEDLNLLTADVSVAFMNAPVEQDACDLVLLPPNMTIGGLRVIVLLYKAMNGLRRAPLLWFLELQRTVYEMGGQDTFESTLFRISTKKGFILVLVYVDDLLIASRDEKEGADCRLSSKAHGDLEDQTHWEDPSTQEGCPSVLGENHLSGKGWGVFTKFGGE